MTMTPIQRRRILAQLFTRPVFSLLSKTDGAQAALSFLTATGVASPRGYQSAASIFEAAFSELNGGYRNEYIYKATIANRIVFGKHNPRTTSMQVELPVGRSIVDIAVFNGTSTAYEIKTEFDTPKRLLSQSSDYLRAFDHVYVVTHPDFADRYASLVDERVGIAAITGRNSISVLRSAMSNAAHIEASAVFRMLRRSEYVDAVEWRCCIN
ncbi:sce7726 family protein, partial [Ralstonia solanacearum]|uniref:sce7726 family protein n=4 Tax=Ralstonia solanacearum TaxID=305 RepID=UPI00070EDE36